MAMPPRPPAKPPTATAAPAAPVGAKPPTAPKPAAKPTSTAPSSSTSSTSSTSSAPVAPSATKAHPAVGADGKLAKKELILQFTPFVRGIAAKIKKSLAKNIEFDDLVAYGMTGLLEAAERYDPKMGANFMTFSYYRIRGAIYDGLRGMGWVNRTEYQKIRFEERATAYLENMASRETVGGQTTENSKSVEDNIEELAAQVSQLVTIYVTSLEAMEDLQVEDKERMPLDDRFADVEMKKHVREAMAKLPEADREIIQMYYFKELSLQEVGNRLGLSKSWTSRRHAQAIERLTKLLQEILKGTKG